MSTDTQPSLDASGQRSSAPSPCILLVEDEAYIRQLNEKVLTNAGYQVAIAEDGAVAWDILQRVRYDLVVTDNNMPGLTGIDLLKNLHAAGHAVPVIMATGQFPQEEFSRHPEIRPATILLKPYTAQEFLMTVQNILAASASGQNPHS